MIMERFITSSEVGTFRQCKRKWWLKNHRGLRSRQPTLTGAMTLGSRVHEALEAHYDPDDDNFTPFDVLTERCEREVAEHPEHEEEILAEHDLAWTMVEGYFEWLAETGADQDYEIVAVEQEVSTPVVSVQHGTVYRLLGKLDRQVQRRSDGVRLFMDDKTVGSLGEKPQLAELDTQMLLYNLISKMIAGEDERVEGGMYNMLRKSKRTARAKPPFYDRHEFDYTDIHLNNFFQSLLGTIDEIADAERRLEAGEDHHRVVPPTSGRHCTWGCQFFVMCSMLDDGSDAEYVLREEFEVGDPLERYEDLEVSA